MATGYTSRQKIKTNKKNVLDASQSKALVKLQYNLIPGEHDRCTNKNITEIRIANMYLLIE